MKTRILLFTTLLISLTALAQHTITGSITDAITGEPLSYATVSITDTVQKKVVAFDYTNDNGVFALPLPKTFTGGILEVQYLGYKVYFETVTLTTFKDVYPIVLQPESNSLDEVTVSTMRKAVEMKGDKVIFNVEQSGIATGNNGLETMDQIPGISLDKDENIQFRGSTGVQIMINGRKSLLQGEALREFLRALNGQDIQSVEIIAQPSARYDATGTTGIINIVLKKNYEGGISGNLNANASYGEYYKNRFGGKLYYNDSLWNINATGYYYQGNSVNHRVVKQTILLEEGVRKLEQRNEWLPETESGNFNLGIERRLNANQLVSTEWQYYKETTLDNTYGTTREVTNGALTDEVKLTQKNNEPTHQVSGNVFYNFTSDSATTKLDAQLNYAYYSTGANGFQRNDYLNSDSMTLNGINRTKYNLCNAQVDFNQDIAKKWHVETGVKYSYVAMNYYNEYDTNNSNLVFIPDSLLVNNFDYKENLLAGYGQVSLNLKKWGFLAGMRAENYRYNAVSKNNGISNSDNYTNWFPSISANYKTGDHQYQISYSKRIGRPGYLSLNPYYQYLDAYTLSVGNPQLKPRLYDSFQLNYIYKNALNISLYGYVYKNGFINVIDYQEDANYNLTYQANASQGSTYGLSVSLPYEIKDWWSMQLEMDGGYSFEKSVVPEYSYDGKGFNYELSLYQRFTLPKDWTITWNGFYSGRSTLPNGYGRATADFSFSVKKMLWDDKIQASFGCTNVMKNSFYSSVTNVNNVSTDWTNRWETRRFSLQLTWYFGGKKEKSIKGTSLGEEKGRM